MEPEKIRRRRPLSDGAAALGFIAIAVLSITQIVAGVAPVLMWALLVLGILGGLYYTAMTIRGVRDFFQKRRDGTA